MTDFKKLDSKFFQQFLEQIAQIFCDNNMCILKCLDKDNEDVYVLCAVTPVTGTTDVDLVPVATLFNKSPYQIMSPAGVDSIVAIQNKPNPIKINASSPRAFSVN
jgi:hypothetical protein